MNKKAIMFVLLIFPIGVLAQCTPTDQPWVDVILAWVYDIFGDRLLKVFGCLYGLSLVFKIVDLLSARFVMWTATSADNEYLKKLYAHWSYKVLSFLAELFLRLKLPRRKR